MALQETLENISKAPTPNNEEEAKNKFVLRILRDLGWDPFGPEVEYEVAVGNRRRAIKVDIALKSGKQLYALVEVKAPEKNLDDHVEQVIEYAYYGGVDICALTTGLEWWLYLPREGGGVRPDECRFAELNVKKGHIEQIAYDLERYLGKDNLLNREAVNRAQQALDARRKESRLSTEIPQVWESMLEEPDDDLVELLSNRVYNEVGLRPTPKQVSAVLRKTSSLTSPPVPTTRTLPSSTVHEQEDFSKRKRRPPKRNPTPTGFRLWGKYHRVATHRAILTGVVEALYERHGGDVDLLLALGEKKISRYGTEHISSYEIGSGASKYYIEVNLSGAGAQDRARLFLSTLGYSHSDLEVLYD